MSTEELSAVAEALGVEPALAAEAAALAAFVRVILYPLAKRLAVPRTAREAIVLGVVVGLGVLASYATGTPVAWSVSAALTGAASAMFHYHTTKPKPEREGNG